MNDPAGRVDVKTTSHIYQRKDLLGIGSSCEVYIGVQKVTGEQHALKIFKDSLWARSEERRREVAALRRLQHPNIVKFFGEEEEAGTGRVILVLELCKEGSLHTYLHEPCNSRGLDDTDFLLLLDHLSAGLRYLNHHNYVHRDIKPGNILRHIYFDGSCVYKLSDFGASRHLEDGDLFMSLAGTEEYLHPAVYEKAFVDRGAVVCFDSSVDLWSVGCTLYQAVTGQIPFRPHGGVRTNRGVMFQMIAQKPFGVISGYQATENGQITWEKHIPSTCRMSQPMKETVRNLICRLLEKDQALLFSRDQFYQHVQTVINLVQIVVFNVEEVTYVIIYIKPNCSLAEFQDQVAGKTDIMAGDQLLYHRGRKLADLTADVVTVDCLTCDFCEPVILISKCETDFNIREPKVLQSPPAFQSNSTVEKDCHVTHKMAVFLSDIHERISTIVNLQNSSGKACSCMIFYLEKRQSYLERSYSNINTRLLEARSRQDIMDDLESKRVKVTMERNSSISHRCKYIRSAVPKLQGEMNKIKAFLTHCKEAIKTFAFPLVSSSECSNNCVKKAKSLATKGRDIWRDMYSRKKQKPLSERQQLCHTRDRRNVEEMCVSSRSLYEEHCAANWKRVLPALSQRIERFHSLEKNLDSVQKTLTQIKGSVEKLEDTLVQVSAFSGRAWNDVTNQINSLRKGLVKEDGATLRVMKETDDSIDSMETLLKGLPDLDPIPELKFDKVDNG